MMSSEFHVISEFFSLDIKKTNFAKYVSTYAHILVALHILTF